jgi:hypothetical protein
VAAAAGTSVVAGASSVVAGAGVAALAGASGDVSVGL